MTISLRRLLLVLLVAGPVFTAGCGGDKIKGTIDLISLSFPVASMGTPKEKPDTVVLRRRNASDILVLTKKDMGLYIRMRSMNGKKVVLDAKPNNKTYMIHGKKYEGYVVKAVK